MGNELSSTINDIFKDVHFKPIGSVQEMLHTNIILREEKSLIYDNKYFQLAILKLQYTSRDLLAWFFL